MKLPKLISGTQFKRSFLVAAVAASCATSAFALPAFTFNPTSLCTTGTCSSFTADNIIISDFADVTMTSSTAFRETGYLQVAAFQLQDKTFTPDGLNTSYQLYIPFSGTGRLTSANTNPMAGPTNGVFDTLTYQFIGKSGGGTGTRDFNSGTVLGTGSLAGGFVSTTQSTSAPGFVPTANIDFKFTPSVASFFTSPTPFYNLGFSSFINTTTEITVNPNGFSVNKGGGSLNFASSTAVPEPATVALFGLGLLGVAASRRKSAKSKNA